MSHFLFRFDRMAWAALLALALAFGTPARAQQGYGGGYGGGGLDETGGSGASEAPKSSGAPTGPVDPYTRAMMFKQKGQYSDAMPLLEAMATLGHGFEIAQLELGKCYYDLGRKATTPEAVTHNDTLGFSWILAAANAGHGTAEQEMVRLYLDGTGVPVDRVEAAKWYLLWHHNPSRMQLGTNEFDAGLEARLKTVMRPEEWKDAQRRADQWHAS
jgi:TPR repeat protein